MTEENQGRAAWRLLFTRPGTIDLDDYSLGDLVPDRQARWVARSLPPTFPMLVADDGRLDLILNRYFSAPQFLNYPRGTQRTYAREISIWCNYLDQEGLTWLDALEDDYLAFKVSRTGPGAMPRPIAGSTWNKAEAALSGLYKWANLKGLLDTNPVPSGGSRVRNSRATNARSQRPDRWVTPATYRLWRSLAIDGKKAIQRSSSHFEVGEVRTDFRARNSLQNSAFANLIFATGLRLQEAGSLLTAEVPRRGQDVWLSSAVTKAGVGRMFYWPEGALREVQQYMLLTRRAAIARARRAGRYDSLHGILWVGEVRESRRGREVVFADTGEVRLLDGIDADMRLRLFMDGDHGPEPMHLWVNERGLPTLHDRWETTFDRLNVRADKSLREAGYQHDQLWIKPHSLRFSFALSLLASLHRRTDARTGVNPLTPYDEERYRADYEEVQGRLGHADLQTTIDTYLRPMKRLRGDGVIFTSLGRADGDLDSFFAHFAHEVVYGGGDAEVRDLVRPDLESGVIPRV